MAIYRKDYIQPYNGQLIAHSVGTQWSQIGVAIPPQTIHNQQATLGTKTPFGLTIVAVREDECLMNIRAGLGCSEWLIPGWSQTSNPLGTH